MHLLQMKITLFYERRRFEHLPANAKWRKRIITILFLLNLFSQIKCMDFSSLMFLWSTPTARLFDSSERIDGRSHQINELIKTRARARQSSCELCRFSSYYESDSQHSNESEAKSRSGRRTQISLTKSPQIAVLFMQKYRKKIGSLSPAIRRTM